MNWERVRLGEVLEYEQPTNYIVSSEDYDDSFETPVLTAGKSFILGYTNEKENIYTNVPVIIFDDFTTAAKYVDFPFKVKSSAMKILKALENKADIKYLYYKMQTINFNATEHKRYWISKYSQIEIPLPPLSVQKEIVKKLDKAAAIREKSKALLAHYDALAESLFIELFGDPISNEKGWEISTFGAEFKISSGGTPKTNIGEYWEGGNIPWIGSNMCKDEIIYQNDGKFITQKGLENSSTKIFKVNSVLVALVGATIGKTALLKFDTAINQNIAGIVVSDKFNSYFVFYCLRNLYGKFLELGEGSFKMANLSFVRNLEIPLPPLSLQVKFAEMVENIEEQKARAKAEIEQSEAVFQALLQESFG